MKRPSDNDYAPFYAGYIKHIEGDDIIKFLNDQLIEDGKLFDSISEEKASYSYTKGKWTIKEVVGHLIDVERVMAYRALCIARGEKQSLPGFEQDDYVANGKFNNRTLKNLTEELRLVRESNLAMFKNFDEEMLDRRGVANNFEVTALSFLFIIAGHEMHHMKILKERYLN